MSAASSKPKRPVPSGPTAGPILDGNRGHDFLIHNPHCGAWALVEFLLLASLVVYVPHTAQTIHLVVYPAVLILAVLCVIHSAVMLRRRVWDGWFSLLAVLLIYFLAQAVAGALVYVYPLLRGWSEAKATFWLNNSVMGQFSFFALATGLTLGGLYGYVKRFRISPTTIGLRRPRWEDLAFGLAAVVPYFVIYGVSVALVSHLVPGLNVNQKQQLGFDNAHGLLPLSLAFVSLVVLPPILEEIMVRGLLYSSLKKTMPTLAAVVVTSAIFASAHLPEGGDTGPLYIAALDTFVLSLVLIFLREKTGGLYASMTLHALKNGVAFTVLFGLHVH